jgi:hypothetical protein
MITKRQRIIHHVGKALLKWFSFYDSCKQVIKWHLPYCLAYPALWTHDWLEKNHACCIRHGYDKDL